MNGVRLACQTCASYWPLGYDVNFYERQDLESRACPKCGTATLTCLPVGKPLKRTGRSTTFSSAKTLSSVS